MELVDLVDDVVHGSGLLPLTVTATSIARPSKATIASAAFTWNGNLIEDAPASAEFQRREVRRVGSFRRSEVPTAPRGTTFDAPEKPGASDQTWRVDAHVDTQANYLTVVVVPEPSP